MTKLDFYVLEASGDKRDRKGDIEEMLRVNRTCILGSGTFYVSGVTMPDGTALMGLGECSEVILMDEVTEGYAVSMGSYCTVKNLTLKGSEEETERPTEVGKRHGIGFLGDATGVENSDLQIGDGIIDSCRIRCFSGGGITCHGTGYSPDCSLCVSNCRIHACGAGIHIPYFSEYHKFSNIMSTKNLYGCINNGGNNVFVGCSFDCNTIGYLIDNSHGQSENNSHGSCVACTFNHTDHNQGVGIKLLGVGPGYVFSDCQLFYSKIVAEDCLGVQFNNFNCGRDEGIYVKGGGVVRFSGCLFGTQPVFTLEDAEHVMVENCYTRQGEVVDPFLTA